MNVEPLDEAAQALMDAGQALQKLASGPLGLGPSFVSIDTYAREAGASWLRPVSCSKGQPRRRSAEIQAPQKHRLTSSRGAKE